MSLTVTSKQVMPVLSAKKAEGAVAGLEEKTQAATEAATKANEAAAKAENAAAKVEQTTAAAIGGATARSVAYTHLQEGYGCGHTGRARGKIQPRADPTE